MNFVYETFTLTFLSILLEIVISWCEIIICSLVTRVVYRKRNHLIIKNTKSYISYFYAKEHSLILKYLFLD